MAAAANMGWEFLDGREGFQDGTINNWSSANDLIKSVKDNILKHANPERIYLYESYAERQADQSSDMNIAYDDKNFKEQYNP